MAMLDSFSQVSYLDHMKVKHNWREYLLLMLLTLLLTPLRDSVLIPAIENGVVVSLVLVGLAAYVWKKSAQAIRDRNPGI